MKFIVNNKTVCSITGFLQNKSKYIQKILIVSKGFHYRLPMIRMCTTKTHELETKPSTQQCGDMGPQGRCLGQQCSIQSYESMLNYERA